MDHVRHGRTAKFSAVQVSRMLQNRMMPRCRQHGRWGRAARWHGLFPQRLTRWHGSALHRLTRWHGVVNRHLTRWGAASAPHRGPELNSGPHPGARVVTPQPVGRRVTEMPRCRQFPPASPGRAQASLTSGWPWCRMREFPHRVGSTVESLNATPLNIGRPESPECR